MITHNTAGTRNAARQLTQVASAYRELFTASGGGALGLFTAISRLREVQRRIAPPLDAAATMHVSVANSVLTIADPATRARVYAGRLPAWSLAGVGPLLEEAFRGPIADVEAGRNGSSARAEDLLSNSARPCLSSWSSDFHR